MTESEFENLRIEAQKIGLSGAIVLNRTEASKICNGIGPSWMPGILRDFVSGMNPSLECAAAIHDLRYDDGGRLAAFFEANAEFEQNGIKTAKYRYSWFDPRRYIVIHQAKKFRKLCDVFGRIAWRFRE